MVASKIKRLAAAREKLAKLELVVETELYEELFGLHEKYGFANVKSFIKAIRLAAKSGGRRKAQKVGRPKKVVAVKTRKRAVITDATRARVKKLVNGGKSGSQIAKAVGISLPSVQNIKKALGLVKSRGSKVKETVRKPKARESSGEPSSTN